MFVEALSDSFLGLGFGLAFLPCLSVVANFESVEIPEECFAGCVAYGEHGMDIGMSGAGFEQGEADEEGTAVIGMELKESGVGQSVLIHFFRGESVNARIRDGVGACEAIACIEVFFGLGC